MAKNPEVVIGTFAGGITGSPRSGSNFQFSSLKHFQITTDPNILTPHYGMEADEDTSLKIQQMWYASDGKLYGRGVDSATGNKIQIYVKDPELTASWGTVTSGVSANNRSFLGCFRDFEDYFIGVTTTGDVFVWGDFTGTPTFTQAWDTLGGATPTYVTQGIIGPNKDFYFGWDNKVALIPSGTDFTGAGTVDEDNFVAPSNLTVRSLENYGNYLAIGCSGNGITSESTVFLWDQVKADPDVRIDFGLEVLWHLGIIDGGLYAFMLSHNSSLTASQKLVIKRWNGGGEQDVETLEALDLGTTGYTLLKEKFIESNRVYFGLNINSDAESNKGVWSYGRPNPSYPLSLVHEIRPVNDTAITTMHGFFKLADYFWVTHSSDGSIERTNDNTTYSATSIAETCIFSGSNPTKKKEIVGCAVSFKPLPANGQVVVKFKANGGSYETVLTEADDNETVAYATQLADGSSFDTWNDCQWRIESTGGAVITGFRFVYKEGVKSPID